MIFQLQVQYDIRGVEILRVLVVSSYRLIRKCKLFTMDLLGLPIEQ